MNSINIIGRITHDPELKYTPSSVAVTTFDIAVNRKNNREEVDFFSVVAWKNNAEFITKHFRKGSQIAIEGYLATRSWKDKSGNNRKVVEIIVNSVDFFGKRSETSVENQHTESEVGNDTTRGDTSGEEMPF